MAMIIGTCTTRTRHQNGYRKHPLTRSSAACKMRKRCGMSNVDKHWGTEHQHSELSVSQHAVPSVQDPNCRAFKPTNISVRRTMETALDAGRSVLLGEGVQQSVVDATKRNRNMFSTDEGRHRSGAATTQAPIPSVYTLRKREIGAQC